MERIVRSSYFNVTVLGDFSPTTITPRWLFQENFISKADLEAAKINLIHPDASQFSLDGFQFQVLRNTFQITADDERYTPILKDLSINIFTALDRTPITAFGINYNTHFSALSEDDWHQIGHALTPKDVWNKCFKKSGMKTIVIEGENPLASQDHNGGYIHFKVEPSPLIKHGIYVQLNNHFNINKESSLLDNTNYLTDIFKTHWNTVTTDSRDKSKIISEMEIKK